MPRPPRILLPGGLYHVYARGNRHEPIVVTDVDRRVLLASLAEATRAVAWRVWAFVVLDTHYHLLLETPAANLHIGMHRLNSTYAHRFNQAHGYDGHLFQKRYGSEVIVYPGHLLEVIRYIALNAVRAGLCKRPEDWAWSSYAATLGRAPVDVFLSPEAVLDLFADDVEDARRRLQRFVEAGIADDREMSRPP